MRSVKVNGILLLVDFIVTINCLNLKSHGIGDNFYASSISVFRNKAYLTLPRSSCYNNLTDPTLIEVYWNGDKESLIGGRRIIYPSDNSQKWGKCEHLQDAVSVDVEVKKGRLWVLDRGTKKCPPKIVIYNLYTNSELYMYELDKTLHQNVSCLVVDTNEGRNVNAYIGHDDNILTIFSFKDGKHWSLKIYCMNKSESSIFTKHLALSRRLPILYIGVDDSSELFYINLTNIEKSKKVSPTVSMRLPEIKTQLVGYKLGPSAGIMEDIAGGLSYFLVKDFAITRWNTRKSLRAEHHEILKQSFKDLPYVSHIFNGPQNTVWALVNLSAPRRCRNEMEKKKIRWIDPVKLSLPNRIVKLYKLKRKSFGGKSYVIDKSN